MNLSALISKYNVPGPRYTSYPTVPHWRTNEFSSSNYLSLLKQEFLKNRQKGISLYIHLPFCESLCTYCACNTRITKQHKVESPYIKAVLKEFKMYVDLLGEKPLIKDLHLGGGTPTFFSPENLSTLINGIKSLSVFTPDSDMSFEAHPANTTNEHLKTLYSLGFKRLSLGIQDFDEKVQDVINRYQTVEDVERVIACARETGYTSTNFDIVYGLPFQTLPTFTGTIDKVIKLKPDRIALYGYAHVPWVKPGQRKYSEIDLPKNEEKLNLYYMAKQKLAETGFNEIGFDHFALSNDDLYKAQFDGRLHRNFMGYTVSDTNMLIALGVSSISDIGCAMAQNEKHVETYEQLINEGKWPIVKGHISDETDLIIRGHILNLMCKYKTQLGELPIEKTIWENNGEKFNELQNDGIITLSDDKQIAITPLGRQFIRNVCMVFDRNLLWEEGTQKFSLTV